MKKLSAKKYAFFSVIILLGILIDQITKYLTVRFIPLYSENVVIKKLFALTYITNKGAAWGMFADSRWIFMTISTIAILGMALYLYLGFSMNRLYEISFAIIISGGIGNMIDRLALGYVVDMIQVLFIDFPVFNVADSLVCIGAGLLILALILDIVKESKSKKENNDASDGN